MRCQFCGWDNPSGKETCEKCNKPLASNVREESYDHEQNDERAVGFIGSQIEGAFKADVNKINHDRPTDRRIGSDGTFNPKATVREASSDNLAANECPDCGYPLENGVCSACGYSSVDNIRPEKVPDEVRKTLRPIRKAEKGSGFKLVPISEETGMPEGDEISYDGNNVILNRDNTDPDNSTITSREQAYIINEHGKWSIEDRSEYKTTFVQASRKIEIQSGDLILLGNQLYRFEI